MCVSYRYLRYFCSLGCVQNCTLCVLPPIYVYLRICVLSHVCVLSLHDRSSCFLYDYGIHSLCFYCDCLESGAPRPLRQDTPPIINSRHTPPRLTDSVLPYKLYLWRTIHPHTTPKTKPILGKYRNKTNHLLGPTF